MDYTRLLLAQRSSATVNGPSSARSLESSEPAPESKPPGTPPDVAAMEDSAHLPHLAGRPGSSAAQGRGATLPGGGIASSQAGYAPVRNITGSAPGSRPTSRR
jgi:hypothetical protein